MAKPDSHEVDKKVKPADSEESSLDYSDVVASTYLDQKNSPKGGVASATSRTYEPIAGTGLSDNTRILTKENEILPSRADSSPTAINQLSSGQTDPPGSRPSPEIKPVQALESGSTKISPNSGLTRSPEPVVGPSTPPVEPGKAGQSVGQQFARGNLEVANLVASSDKSGLVPGVQNVGGPHRAEPEARGEQSHNSVKATEAQVAPPAPRAEAPAPRLLDNAGGGHEPRIVSLPGLPDQVSRNRSEPLHSQQPRTSDAPHVSDSVASHGNIPTHAGSGGKFEQGAPLAPSHVSNGAPVAHRDGAANSVAHGFTGETSQGQGGLADKNNSPIDVRSGASEIRKDDGKIADATGNTRRLEVDGHIADAEGRSRRPEMTGKIAESGIGKADRLGGDRIGKDDKGNGADAPAVFMQFLGGGGGSSFVGTKSFGWPFRADKEPAAEPKSERGKRIGSRESKEESKAGSFDPVIGTRSDKQNKGELRESKKDQDSRDVRSETQKNANVRGGKNEADAAVGKGSQRKDDLGAGRVADSKYPARRQSSSEAGIGAGLVGAGGKIIEEFVAVLKGIVPADTPRSRQASKFPIRESEDTSKTTLAPRARTRIQPPAPNDKVKSGDQDITQPSRPVLKGPARPYIRLHNPDGTYGGAMQPGGADGGRSVLLPIKRMLSETAKHETSADQDKTVPNRFNSANSAHPENNRLTGAPDDQPSSRPDKPRMPAPRLIDDSKTMESIPMINPDLLARGSKAPLPWLQQAQDKPSESTKPELNEDTISVNLADSASINDGVAKLKPLDELEDTLIEEDEEPEPTVRRAKVAKPGDFRKVRYANKDIDEQEQTWPLADEVQSAQSSALANNSYLYIVKPGDTIESVSAKVLGDPLLAPLLFRKNRQHVLTESEYGVHDLRPGATLDLPTPAEIAEFRLA